SSILFSSDSTNPFWLSALSESILSGGIPSLNHDEIPWHRGTQRMLRARGKDDSGVSNYAKSTIAAGTQTSGSEPYQLTGNSRRLAEGMVARGERELSLGNVSGARQFLLRAAETRLARAVFLLGSTYDQHEFALLRIHCVNQTRAWR